MNMAVDIKGLIEQGRSSRLDWLSENADITQIAETMSAIANSAGGTILLGISEDQVTGVKDTELLIDRVISAALSTDPPLIIPVPQIISHEEHPLVLVQVPSGMPNVYAFDGRYLNRIDGQNSALKPRDLRRLMLERGEISFETEVASNLDGADLDWDKVQDYIKNLRGIGHDEPEQVLLKRGCMSLQGQKMRPTHAGVLLFGNDPQRYIRSSEITAVRFASESMSDTFSRQDINGTLIDQISRAETFLFDTLRKDVTLQSTMARKEQFEYPMEAARELVVNAVAHRDYSISGDTIRLFVFSNRMEIQSPGGLPGPITIENIKDERFSRNPIIVQVLADLHFIERLGYGVDRVIELMHEQKLRAPEFEERAGGFRVVLYNTKIDPASSAAAGVSSSGAGSDTSGENQRNFQGLDINPRQESALSFLQRSHNGRITNSDLKGIFPDVHPETIRRDLVDLVNKEILIKMGQKRGSYYIFKPDSEERSNETEA